jgi:hypothetical protein
MIILTVDGKEYRVEFRYEQLPARRRKSAAAISKTSPEGSVWPQIRGISTCVILQGRFVFIGTAFCSGSDAFSKIGGRERAFEKLINSVAPLRKLKLELWTTFRERFPMKPTPVPRLPLTADQIRQTKYSTDALARRQERIVIHGMPESWPAIGTA